MHPPLAVFESIFTMTPKCLLLQNKNTWNRVRKYSSKGSSLRLFGGVYQFLAILTSSPMHFLDRRQPSVVTLDREDRTITYHQLQLDCSRLAGAAGLEMLLVMRIAETTHYSQPFSSLQSFKLLAVRAEEVWQLLWEIANKVLFIGGSHAVISSRFPSHVVSSKRERTDRLSVTGPLGVHGAAMRGCLLWWKMPSLFMQSCRLVWFSSVLELNF